MIDLSVMKHLWTEEGAREVFAQLVTQCVLANHPGARAIRPDPGDEGVDTFVGEFHSDVRIWQAKYFCNGIGESQQKQIRESWKACLKSSLAKRITHWTLCVPCDLSIDEEKWWQGWRAREAKNAKVPIDLWAKPHFTSFNARPGLADVFRVAMQRNEVIATAADAVAAMGTILPRQVEKPPSNHEQRMLTAVFVRKLEAAGITAHRAARSAFYNFELLRKAIEEGTPEEVSALDDLQERTYHLWECQFNAHFPDRLGRQLFNAVEAEMKEEDTKRLASVLNLHLVHKKGGLHYWADICEAGWTKDHKTLGSDGDSEEREG
jgi:hypothetical protein